MKDHDSQYLSRKGKTKSLFGDNKEEKKDIEIGFTRKPASKETLENWGLPY